MSKKKTVLKETWGRLASFSLFPIYPFFILLRNTFFIQAFDQVENSSKLSISYIWSTFSPGSINVLATFFF